MLDSVYKTFGNKLRVRVCGLCVVNDKILMINHRGLQDGDFWAPPGGGLLFGENIEHCLKREFEEETNLAISILEFQFISELIKPPLHAIELFFKVEMENGILKRGFDPEMEGNQLIEEVKFMSWMEIDGLAANNKHGIFNTVSNSSKIQDLKGHFKL